jgi:hypothetical protein
MHTYRLKGASGKVANQAFSLQQRSVLGSDPECDLPIQENPQDRPRENTIAARHAEIELRQDGSLILSNLDARFETLVNGKPVDQTHLFSGDEIRIGSCRWVVQAPGLRPEKILHEAALKPRRSALPWLIAVALIAAAALAWYRGYLPF